MLKKMEGKFYLEEGYNLEAAKRIKPVMKCFAAVANEMPVYCYNKGLPETK
jgi:hypothetical protein